jgi:hypothetical protein
MTIDVSYFSLASLISLALFLAIMVPRAGLHVANLLAGRLTGRAVPVDRWLVAIVVSVLLCIGFGVAGLMSQKARDLASSSEAVALSFLLFATPALLQVLRAFAHRRAKTISAFSQMLVVLAVLSLPASMAIPTAGCCRPPPRPARRPRTTPPRVWPIRATSPTPSRSTIRSTIRSPAI